MRAQHINITLPMDLKDRIDLESKREHIARSTFIQKAVSLYLDLSRKKKIRGLLVKGYSEMSGELKKITGEFSALDSEASRYAD